MRLDSLLGEEVRVTRGDDALDRQTARRCGGRGAAGSASTDRGRARRRVAALGSSTRPPSAGADRTPARRRASRGTRPRPCRRAPATRPAAPLGATATSRAVSSAGSHEPFDPSVQTRWKISHPAAAHLASVPPQPNSTSSGWAPMASARAGTGDRSTCTFSFTTGRSRGRRARRRPMPATARTPPAAPGPTAGPRWHGARTTLARRRSGTRRRAGTHATLVPSSRRSGTSVTPSKWATHARSVARGRSAWATITLRAPAAANWSTPASTAPFSPRPGSASTIAPRDAAHGATPASSHTTATGSAAAAASTRSAIARASAARRSGAKAGVNRTLASENAFTGTRTATGPRATTAEHTAAPALHRSRHQHLGYPGPRCPEREGEPGGRVAAWPPRLP